MQLKMVVLICSNICLILNIILCSIRKHYHNLAKRKCRHLTVLAEAVLARPSRSDGLLLIVLNVLVFDIALAKTAAAASFS
jgi:hypothetical protein